MSSFVVFDQIETYLRDKWHATDIVFENEDYPLPDTPKEFVFAEVYGDSLDQVTLGAPGNNQWDEGGQLYLHVMTPNGTGSRAARRVAGELVALFRERPLEQIYFSQMSIGSGEPGRSFANYYAMTVTIQWDRSDFSQIL